MLVSKGISLEKFVSWSWKNVLALLVYMGSVGALYYFEFLKVSIPWLPLSVIGTAVAFYVGFKNNQSYDRLWEARKIGGGIVNDSRTWGMLVDAFINNTFRQKALSPEEIYSIKQRLIYRHIAWLYAHRSQLLLPTSWEHITQGGYTSRKARVNQERYGIGLLGDELTRAELQLFLKQEEHDRLIEHVNTATQIINEQSRHISQLRDQNILDDFRHIKMIDVLQSFYTLQGKNERIKKYPFPRQYAVMSRYFVNIFVFIFPFSMIPELMKLGDWGFFLSIAISVLIGWVYVTMEAVGDYSENPFQGMVNDIPMMSLCRTIEIDLREMLGETELPPAIQAKNDVLM